jgi:predicted alpha/beta superfamily hydrolase
MNLCFKHIIGIAAVIVVSQGLSAVNHKEVSRELFTLHATSTKDEYSVNVSFPKGYHSSSDTYPLLVVLDAEYAFNTVADISDHLQRGGAVRPYVVVGVSYGVGFGASLAAKRTRDFTPSIDKQRVVTKVPSAYYRFVKEELIPTLASRYRIQPNDITAWTYSLSGTFATWLNYHDRQVFKNYIISSPNLEYGLLAKIMSGEVFTADDAIPKKVFLSMDPNEVDDPKSYFKPNLTEINEPLQQLIGTFKGYEFRFFVTRGESHATSWLTALPTGLRFVFGKDSGNAPALLP